MATSLAIATRRSLPRLVVPGALALLGAGLLLVQGPPTLDASALPVFGVVALASELLRLDFPDRRGVAVTALPFTLALAAAGPATAVWAIVLATVAATLLRRPTAADLLAGFARASLAGTAGSLLALLALGRQPGAEPLAAGLWAVAAGGGFAAFSELFGLIERRGTARLSRVDLIVSVALAPVAVVAWAVEARAGVDGLVGVGGASLALLAVVRSAVNSATHHADLRRLYDLVERERSKLSTLLERSGEGIFLVDGAGRVSQVNQALKQLIGRGHTAIGRTIPDALDVRLESGELLHVALERVRPGQPLQAEASLTGADGQPRDVLLSYAIVPSPDGEYGGIGIVRDVTPMKEAQRERDDFVAVMTHDLRQPLTGLLGYAQLIEQGIDRGQPADKTRHYAQGIRRGGDQMLRMINNLLELARLEGGQLEIEAGEVRLAQVVDEVLMALDPQVLEKRLDVRVELPRDLPPLVTSESLLRECLANLVGNAVKYTPEEGRVTVSAHPTDGEVVLTVADSGIGISPDELPHIFQRFFRSRHAEVRKLRGSGLGLALTKSMIEQLGGSISAASEPGMGTTFTLRLPIRHPVGARR